ncbi:hypothetical protein F1880_009094 [Penicillium rolfsii]|nr:hypothetical protein F1880_009094 [Penicillium rolfsii]
MTNAKHFARSHAIPICMSDDQPPGGWVAEIKRQDFTVAGRENRIKLDLLRSLDRLPAVHEPTKYHERMV